MKRLIVIILCFCYAFLLNAQGQVTGDLQHGFNVHIRDENIGAADNQVYDNLKSSSDTWMNIRYRLNNFEFGVRYDMFINSISFAGASEVNGMGLGFWYFKTKVKDLGITAGHFYDQLGSGTTFRAFESRGVGIDNALVGLRLTYDLPWNLNVKAFTGRQKNMRDFLNGENPFLNVYKPAISGIGIEGFYDLNGKKEGSKTLTLAPGLTFVNRVLNPDDMNSVAEEINSYPVEERFLPKYNVYLFSAYNTLTVGRFSLYTEFAGKSKDNIVDNVPIVVDGVETTSQRLRLKNGYVALGSLTYSQKGLGISLQAKKTSYFELKTQPKGLEGNDGIINFLPPQTRQNSLRLLSRYNHATQFLDELAFQVDVTYTPKRGVTFNANFSDVRNSNERLYREYYFETSLKPRKKKWKLLAGVQAQDYNQFIFEQKGIKGELLTTLTPFTEFTWKFNRKKSLRTELQYMLTKRDKKLFGVADTNPDEDEDKGDWAYGLIEFNIAPHWSFSVSNAVNFHNEKQSKENPDDADVYKLKVTHFPIIYASYTLKATRFEASYAKQNEGIICTGGVCRFQPAFSGVRLGVTTSF